MTDDVRHELLVLYREVDAAVSEAGPVCIASGRCCRFKEYGHALFISQLEAELLLETAPPYEAPVSADFCPFQINNLCTAREQRPLGCRIYYCDPSYQATICAISEQSIQRLKKIVERYRLTWHYAPLHTHLNAAAARTPLPTLAP